MQGLERKAVELGIDYEARPPNHRTSTDGAQSRRLILYSKAGAAKACSRSLALSESIHLP